jgi:hypothetical protein
MSESHDVILMSEQNLPSDTRIHPSGYALYCKLAVVKVNRTIVIRRRVRETYSDDGIWVRVDAVSDEFNYRLGVLKNRCLHLISSSLASCSRNMML